MIFSVPPDPKSLSLDLFNSDNRFVKFIAPLHYVKGMVIAIFATLDLDESACRVLYLTLAVLFFGFAIFVAALRMHRRPHDDVLNVVLNLCTGLLCVAIALPELLIPVKIVFQIIMYSALIGVPCSLVVVAFELVKLEKMEEEAIEAELMAGNKEGSEAERVNVGELKKQIALAAEAHHKKPKKNRRRSGAVAVNVLVGEPGDAATGATEEAGDEEFGEEEEEGSDRGHDDDIVMEEVDGTQGGPPEGAATPTAAPGGQPSIYDDASVWQT